MSMTTVLQFFSVAGVNEQGVLGSTIDDLAKRIKGYVVPGEEKEFALTAVEDAVADMQHEIHRVVCGCDSVWSCDWFDSIGDFVHGRTGWTPAERKMGWGKLVQKLAGEFVDIYGKPEQKEG